MADPAVILRQLATDADLLRWFAATRDGAAFAELVRRHGPVVLAACRRGVRNHHDADDAFQAVFLVLAREAGGIRRPELLGNWLYQVAVGVARNARRAAARRRVREVQGVDVPEPAAPPTSTLHDLGPLLDEELDALPAIYRDAVVLCDLRGVSRADAAASLGIPLGTLASRLDGGRKKLAARLVRRGVTLSVAAVLVEARAVAVPEGLLTETCEVVATWSGGGALPPSVLKLVQGGLGVRRAILVGLVAAVGATVVAGLAAARLPSPQPPPPAAIPPKEAPRPAPVRFERLVAAVNPGAFSPEIPSTLTLTPEGKCVYEVVGYPARGTVPAWPAAKRTHTLPPDRMRRVVAELKATEWLAAAPAQEPLQLHQPKYKLTVHRGGKVTAREFEGEPRPYKELLTLARGLASQEFLAYQLEDVPGRSADARARLDSYVRAELGGAYGKPVDAFAYGRFGGWASRVVRAPASRPADDVATAARLVGLVRLASERDPLTALTSDDNPGIREAAREALRRLPAPK